VVVEPTATHVLTFAQLTDHSAASPDVPTGSRARAEVHVPLDHVAIIGAFALLVAYIPTATHHVLVGHDTPDSRSGARLSTRAPDGGLTWTADVHTPLLSVTAIGSLPWEVR
jgi:hypothetical protein